jgi:hypothetical protein
MVFFQTKNPTLGKFWRALEWKMFYIYFMIILEYFMAIWPVWYSLWSFGIFFAFWYVWTKKNLATMVLNGFYFTAQKRA